MPTPRFADCAECSDYARRRMRVVFPAIRRASNKAGAIPAYTAALYFSAIHKRHTEGKTL